jgi:hypothetical protein
VRSRLFLGIIAILPLGWSSAAGADLCVSPGGNDANPGTAAAPLATLAGARDAVRRLKAGGLDHDVVVSIRGGVYPQAKTLRFGPEDAGDERHSITYRAAPGEKVVLSGGRRITGWKKGDGPIWTAELPEVKAGKWYFRQLFVDGRRAVRARTPNAGEWWTLKPVGKNSDANDATITMMADHPIRVWKNVTDVEVTWLINNDGTRKRLGSVRAPDNTFTLPPPHAWPHGLPHEYNISYPRDSQPGYFENALEMLDQPGEWCLDRHTGVLSYWPRKREDLSRAEVVAPVLQHTLLLVQGTRERPVRNVHFQGMRVAYVDWPLPPAGFAAQFGCLQLREDKDPKGPKRFEWISAAVSFTHARGCTFLDGAIEHAGGIGLAMLGGCTENVVEGNDIGDLGGGGVVAGAIRNRDTWRWAEPLDKDDHKGYRIANNHIHNCGNDYFGSIGIFTSLTQDMAIAHNLIHDVSYSGIVLDGNETAGSPLVAKNNVVEYNHIHHVVQVAQDGAAIYTSFPQADRGATIRGNLIHDTGHLRQPNGFCCGGLYVDGIPGGCGPCTNLKFIDNVVFHSDGPLMVGLKQTIENKGFLWLDNITYRSSAAPEYSLISTPGDGPSAEVLEALESTSGLERAYRRSLLGVHSPAVRPYRLTDESPAMDVWTVRQFHWPDRQSGVVLALRRIDNRESTKTIRLRGLDPDARYEVTDLGSKAPAIATGRALLDQGLTIEIGKKAVHAAAPSHTAVKYHKL